MHLLTFDNHVLMRNKMAFYFLVCTFFLCIFVVLFEYFSKFDHVLPAQSGRINEKSFYFSTEMLSYITFFI